MTTVQKTHGEQDATDFSIRLAYLTTEYPKPSHTFIRREILELERQGLVVERFSIRDCSDTLVDEVDIQESGRTTAILKQSGLVLFFETVRMALLRPGKFAKALTLAFRMGRASDRGVLRHLVYLAEASFLSRLAQQRQLDHFHVHFGTNAASVAMLMKILGGQTFSMTVHGTAELDNPQGNFLGEKVAAAEFVCAVCEYGAAQLYRWSSFEHWPKIKVVHCSVDGKFLAPPQPVTGHANMFLCIGRLSAEKGQLLLIEAFASLVAEGLDLYLVLAGDGDMRHEIERRVTKLNCADRVTITGFIDEHRVRELLNQCRTLVQPSFAEGLPVVLMEALAMGRPVISTCITGIPELVHPGENGWLVTPGNIQQIREAMLDAFSKDAGELSAMGQAGRKKVLANHQCEIETAKLIALFKSVSASIQPQ